jgi:hypothetical protein
MNHILYNIAIIMILSGIIILTSYLTRTYNYQQRLPSNITINDENESLDSVYNMRPSKIYNTMFNEPSLWQSYQTLNQPITQKFI